MSKGLSGVRADSRFSYRKLEAFATYVREQLKFAPTQPVDPLHLFEDLHEISITKSDGKVVPLRSGVIAVEDSEGYTRFDRKRNVVEILASEHTYRRLERRHPRALYFVAHELGHCILHTDQLIRLARMPINQQAAFHRGREDHKPFEDTEWQANAFASALLMPACGLARLEKDYSQLTPALIADQFGVSNEAAGYRLNLYQTRKDELLS